MSSATAGIPIIDISPFVNSVSTEDQKNTVVAQITEACERIGFFIITGHGVSSETFNGAYSVTKRFFELPLDARKTVEGDGSGFIRMEGENLAATLNVSAPSDLKETFNISSRSEQNQWPANVPDLKSQCMDYFEAMVTLATTIMEIFALALKLPQDYFVEYITPPYAILRLASYPTLSEPPKLGQLRAGEHTDYGTLTIVRPDSLGLQARDRSGAWVDVDLLPDSFVVNIGDLMAIWTNNKWQSTLHRVANPTNGYNICRQSLVFFHNPNDDAEIACIETCCQDNDQKPYAKINARAYRKAKSKSSRPPMTL